MWENTDQKNSQNGHFSRSESSPTSIVKTLPSTGALLETCLEQAFMDMDLFKSFFSLEISEQIWKGRSSL